MLKSLFPWKHNKTKQVMAAQPPMDEELILQEANLLPCHVCGRTFLPSPLKKHETVCEKNALKKRKPFDSLKQRVAGTDLANFHQPIYLKKNKEEPVVERNPRQSKWKEKHLEFVTAIRAAKGVPSDRMPSSPTPKPRSTTSLITSSAANEQCPSCDRHFGPKAFDRHVEWCKERKARIQQSPASVQQAKERLEARIKYRVPPLNKSKRTIIREKYSSNSSPHSPEPVFTKNAASTTNLVGSFSRGPSIRKPKSLVNVEKSSEKANRSDIERCGGDKKRNSMEADRKMSLSFGLPVIGSPSPKAESVKSLLNKRIPIPSKKLNNTSINNQVQGMMVSSMSQLEVNRRMVTWKDTVKKSNSIPEHNIVGSDMEKNNATSTVSSKGKISCKTLTKQGTLGCMKTPTSHFEGDIKKAELEDTFNNSKVPPKLTKEKTFCLEKPKQINSRNLPLKRRRDKRLDLRMDVPETKSEVLCALDDSKAAMEKILSSNDVFYKNKITKKNLRNVSNVLKPQRDAGGERSVSFEKNEKEQSKFQLTKDKLTRNDNSKDTNEGREDLDNHFEEISQDEEHLITDKETVNLYENLNELSDSFRDENEDGNIFGGNEKIGVLHNADDQRSMTQWFDENFVEESANEDNDLGNADVFKGEDNRQEYQDEVEKTSEKDSLEDVPNDNNQFNDLYDDIGALSAKIIDNSNSSLNQHDKNDGDNNADQDEFKLKSFKTNTTINLTPSSNFDKSTKVVYLFQSGTNLDLTRDNSQNTLTDKKSWSSFSTSNFERELLNGISTETLIKHTKSSNFNLTKSFSDVNVLNCESESRKFIVPLFLKRRFVFESESVDFRKTCQDIRSISSVPVVHLSNFGLKNDQNLCEDIKEAETVPVSQFKFCYNENGCKEMAGEEKKVNWANVESKERLEILRIAAEKFIEETKRIKPKGLMGIGSVLEEDYSVPKKKRRVYLSDESESNMEEHENKKNDNAVEDSSNCNRIGDPERTMCEDGLEFGCTKDKTIPNSASSSVISEMTPRTVNLVEKIVRGKKLKAEHSNVLLAITVLECEKLLEIDKRCLKKFERRIERRAERETVKLPLIVGEKKIDQETRRAKVEEHKENYVKLPSIDHTRKLPQERKGGNECQETKCKGERRCLEIQSNTSNYDPFEIAQRQFLELLECDDFKPFTPNPSRPHTTVPTPLKTPTTPLPTKKPVKSADATKKGKRESVIDPPMNFKDSLDSVTDNDDFELIENMINERFGEERTDNTNGFYLHNLTQNKDSLNLDKVLDNRKYSDDMSSSIDPRLINENDNLSIPEHFKIDDYSPTSTVDTDITLRNDDVDPYSVQYDTKMESIEPAVEKKPLVKRSLSLVNRSRREVTLTTAKTTKNTSINVGTKKGANLGNKTVSKPSKSHVSGSSSEKLSQKEGKSQKSDKKKGLPLLKRSMTLFDPSPKPSFKNKQEVNDYFNGNDLKTMSSSMPTNMITSMEKSISDTPTLEDTIKAEELFAVDDEMYEEYKKYEEMYLKEKEQNFNPNKKSKNKTIDLHYGLLTASEEDDHSNNSNNKLSNDSAYGSLRKTSKHRSRAPKLSPLDAKHVESTSSSGSENGLNSPAPPSNSQKVSKFCHECGTKFPMTTAKFCVECGVKRLLL